MGQRGRGARATRSMNKWSLGKTAKAAMVGVAALMNIGLATLGAGQVSVTVRDRDEVIDVRVTNVIVPQVSHGRGIVWRPPIHGMQRVDVSAVASDIDINE